MQFERQFILIDLVTEHEELKKTNLHSRNTDSCTDGDQMSLLSVEISVCLASYGVISISNLMLGCHFLCMWWVDFRQLPAAHPATVSLPLFIKGRVRKTDKKAHELVKGWEDDLPITIAAKPQGT